MAPWDAAGGGGGMLGGVARGCVFTSAGEPGIAEAFSFLSAVGAMATGAGERRERQRDRARVKQAEGHRGRRRPAPPGSRLRPPAAGRGPMLLGAQVGDSQVAPRWLLALPTEPVPGPSLPQISPRCAHRWLTSHPPRTREQAWVSPFQVSWRV